MAVVSEHPPHGAATLVEPDFESSLIVWPALLRRNAEAETGLLEASAVEVRAARIATRFQIPCRNKEVDDRNLQRVSVLLSLTPRPANPDVEPSDRILRRQLSLSADWSKPYA